MHVAKLVLVFALVGVLASPVSPRVVPGAARGDRGALRSLYTRISCEEVEGFLHRRVPYVIGLRPNMMFRGRIIGEGARLE